MVYYNMGVQSKIKVKESLAELLKQQNIQTKAKNLRRIQSLIFIKESRFKTMHELAEYLGVHKRTMERWLAKYHEGGIDAMLIAANRKKLSKIITPTAHKALYERVHDPHQAFLSYVDAQQWLLAEFDIQINYPWLRLYMIKHFKTKVKRPRKSHIKKDKQATEAFLKTT